jgi:outer membrane protein TolC
MKNLKLLTLFSALLLAVNPAQALDLDGFLAQVKSRHQGLKALQISKEASDERAQAGDISLVPVLSLKGSWLDDKKQPNFFGAKASDTTQYTLGLTKKFSSGTTMNLNASAIGSENKEMANPALGAFAKYAQGSLGVAVSQSIWKDFFGASTRLRREREATVAEAEKSGYDLQARQLMIGAESAYWDYIYLKEEISQREESLKRSQKIEAWVRRRTQDGIADRADLLNAQALVATRKLQLLNTQDEMVANQKKVRNILELDDAEALPDLSGKMDSPRDIRIRLKQAGRIVRLDAYVTHLEAKSRATAAREVEDSFRSDLTLAGSYNTNSFEYGGTTPDATKNWNQTDTPTSAVSLTWTYMFDDSVKQAAQSTARKEALAADLRSRRQFMESDLSWTELLRRNQELTLKIEAARGISQLQMSRAKAEQDKLSKGRSITTNVINSEQDAAEAELNLTRLLAEQRKLEAQSQMFVSLEDL